MADAVRRAKMDGKRYRVKGVQVWDTRGGHYWDYVVKRI